MEPTCDEVNMGEHRPNILARRPLAAFFALSMLLFLPLFAAAGVAFSLEASGWLQYLTQALSSWSPNFAAVIVTGAISGGAGVRQLLSGFLKWRIKPIWYLVAIGVPIALGFGVAGTYHLLAGRPAGVLASFTVTTFAGTVLDALFRGPLGEEAGWRGFALPRLQARHGALKSSFILGLGIVVWHVPTWFIHGLSGGKLLVFVASFVVALMSFTVVMTWLYNNTEGSLLLAMLMHLAFNVALALSVVPLEVQMAILAGLYLIFALVVTLIASPQESGTTPPQ
jgi:membrane protease YdiL (CAAX protease family)